MSTRRAAGPDRDRIGRVAAMEISLENASAALSRLEAALDGYDTARAELDVLAAYYESPDWLSDYEADERGEFPSDLPRGVLSQDAVWDLLTARDALCKRMAALAAGGSSSGKDTD